jgi:hypothetical protein
MHEFNQQLQRGYLQTAYRGLMKYFRELRSHFVRQNPEFEVGSSIYQGYLDMTYFAIVPRSLKDRKLKIAVVFIYDEFQFELWLSGANRNVQAEYWSLLLHSGVDRYSYAPDPKSVDYLLRHVLITDPDFNNLAAMTESIERGTLEFIEHIERRLDVVDR